MANSVKSDVVSFDSALEESLKHLCELGMSRKLRTEQKDSISTLLAGKDLLAVLPTGFGKSLIFQMLVLVKQIMTGKPSSAVVVCPLQSIVYDQLAEASSMGLTAAALTDCCLEDIESGKYQLIFASAEEVLSKPFLSSLKKTASLFHQNMCAIIVDKSHTVDTWTGQRFVSV
ncbi:uncharacterized protein LOC110050387 [Orbicella faveolata]|uniref:uncharacterized protein LOC110050387 n=1 Tax=Orbicella faveolata TaxID=48498 RepID=UPI0009E653A2|nr:uncharacterized protein LOC110050387 [Orbicella faveolata]